MPLDHRPAPPAAHDNPATAARNARVGLVLFAAYCSLYGGFVVANAFFPQVMDWIALAGVNLAIVTGLGLIAAAFALALLYARLCRAAVREPDRGDQRAGGGR